VPEPPVPSSFLDTLRDLVAWLESSRTRAVVIGGVAASLLGRPRATRDVDVLALVPQDRWAEFLAEGERFGFSPRIEHPLEFARHTHMLLLRHRPTLLDLDMSLAGLEFEQQAVEQGTKIEVGEVTIPLISPEDLLVMKAVAHRPRDVADIEAVLEVRTGLDLDRVQRWLREFSAALDRPEILEDFQAILRHRFR
jgi:predicted nucleotidyltransferase